MSEVLPYGDEKLSPYGDGGDVGQVFPPPAGHQQLLRRRAEQAAAQAGPDRSER